MARTITTPKMLTLAGAALAIAALLLAVVLTAGPTMAQTDPDPKPCGPEDVPDSPDETITEGHYAVFEGYWDSDKETLNLNLCPPSVVHTPETQTDGEGNKIEVEVSTRTTSNVDIRQTVINITDDNKRRPTEDEIRKYPFLPSELVPLDEDGDGQQDVDSGGKLLFTYPAIWWLRLDDPNTENVDEDLPLAMGFSTALLDPDDWYLEDDSGTEVEPLQYEFEVIREPGTPVDEQGHVYAFDFSDGDPIAAHWDSSEIDSSALSLNPGEYRQLQWAFTQPGTYIISVQLKGHVRAANDPAPIGAPADWKPISTEETVVTSEVRQYVFQVGPLTLNEEPAFVVERSVEEHSASDTLVGLPIAVYQGDNDDLTFTLTGPGHSLFSVAADSDGDAQIKVAGDLDYEARSEYRLTLGVSDNKDRESNADAAVDSAILVKISATDLPEAERSVDENSTGGALVGDAIPVANADTSTTYTLSGQGHRLFAVERDSSNNAQIEVADGVVLNYEDAPRYTLNLHADTDGTEDVRVTINVVDDLFEEIVITLTANPSGDTQNRGAEVVFTGTVTGSPVPTSELQYSWTEVDQGGGNQIFEQSGPSQRVAERRTVTRVYSMAVRYEGITWIQSNEIVIAWQ